MLPVPPSPHRAKDGSAKRPAAAASPALYCFGATGTFGAFTSTFFPSFA